MTQFARLSVLVADPSPYMAGLTAAMLRGIGIRSIQEVYDSHAARVAIERKEFGALVIDDGLAPIDGVELTRSLRKTDSNANRAVPIILVFAEIGQARLIEARDAGVTEFIKKPMSAKVLEMRLGATLANPRAFVSAPAYMGPDRRRRKATPAGPDRRESEPSG